MSSGGRIFREPDFVPTKWLLVLLGSVGVLVLGSVSGGIYVADLNSRIEAQDRAIISVGDNLKYQTILKEKLIERLDSIDHRLSLIEGKMEARRREGR